MILWPETAFTGPLRLMEVITMQGLKDVTSIISEKERPSKLVYESVKTKGYHHTCNMVGKMSRL